MCWFNIDIEPDSVTHVHTPGCFLSYKPLQCLHTGCVALCCFTLQIRLCLHLLHTDNGHHGLPWLTIQVTNHSWPGEVDSCLGRQKKKKSEAEITEWRRGKRGGWKGDERGGKNPKSAWHFPLWGEVCKKETDPWSAIQVGIRATPVCLLCPVSCRTDTRSQAKGKPACCCYFYHDVHQRALRGLLSYN